MWVKRTTWEMLFRHNTELMSEVYKRDQMHSHHFVLLYRVARDEISKGMPPERAYAAYARLDRVLAGGPSCFDPCE